MQIKIFSQDVSIQLNSRRMLKDFIKEIFIAERKKLASLHIIFCDDRYLIAMNKKYLHHNTYTDIITFSLAKPADEIIGEIYISVERVKENATLYKTSLEKEIHRVIFHGTLHLCGYQDKASGDKLQMTQKEDYYLDRYFNYL